MKRTIYLTETDIKNIVFDTISKLPVTNYTNEGKLATGAMVLGSLAAMSAGGKYLQNHHSTQSIPQSIFYSEDNATSSSNDDTLNYADYMKNQYKQYGKDMYKSNTGKPLTNSKKQKIEKTKQLIHDVGYKPDKVIKDYIKKYETMHKGWIDDGKGNPTTGWGFKMTPELKKRFPNGIQDTITADKYFDEYCNAILPAFKQATPNVDELPKQIDDALFDLYYNIGDKMYRNSKNLQQALQNKDIDSIIKNLRYSGNGKLRGLKYRSTDRQEIAQYGDYNRDEHLRLSNK